MGAHIECRFAFRQNGDSLRIWLLGDLQAGSAGAHKELFKKVLKLTQRTDRDYLVLMGDLLDAIAHDDKRADPRHLDPEFVAKATESGKAYWTVAQSWVVATLKPYKDRIIAYLTGNHEEAVAKRWADPSAQIAEALGIEDRYCGYEAILYIQACAGKRRKAFEIHLHHGAFGGMTIGGLANRINAYASQWADADVVAWGHSHQCQSLLANPRFKVVSREKKRVLVDHNLWLISTGSFFRTRPDESGRYPDTYAVRSARPPTVLGCGLIEIRYRSLHNEAVWSIEGRAIPAEVLRTL
jgi:predicted phosphodiesterase